MSPMRKKLLLGFKRGLLLRCPNCNAFSIFKSYLKVKDQCDSCGLALKDYPCDDTPPYISTFLAGVVVVPLALWHALYWNASDLTLIAIWIPIVLLFIIFSLPSIKGSVVGVLWALDIKR